jgi:hypothetical protein
MASACVRIVAALVPTGCQAVTVMNGCAEVGTAEFVPVRPSGVTKASRVRPKLADVAHRAAGTSVVLITEPPLSCARGQDAASVWEATEVQIAMQTYLTPTGSPEFDDFDLLGI